MLAYDVANLTLDLWWLGLILFQRYRRAWSVTYIGSGLAILVTIVAVCLGQWRDAFVAVFVIASWVFVRWLHTSDGPRRFRG